MRGRLRLQREDLPHVGQCVQRHGQERRVTALPLKHRLGLVDGPALVVEPVGRLDRLGVFLGAVPRLDGLAGHPFELRDLPRLDRGGLLFEPDHRLAIVLGEVPRDRNATHPEVFGDAFVNPEFALKTDGGFDLVVRKAGKHICITL